MKSETNWIILGCGGAILILGVMSFFRVPAYEKGGWEAMTIFSTALGTIMGYKFGRSMPEQSTDAKPGQSSQVQSTIATTSAPPEVKG